LCRVVVSRSTAHPLPSFPPNTTHVRQMICIREIEPRLGAMFVDAKEQKRKHN
jgi:hypothetical protein